MRIKGFITHKRAEKYEDCQDFFKIDGDKRVLAISDGMSQSIFPQWWAEILVKAYVSGWMFNSNGLENLRVEWMNRVNRFLEKQRSLGKPTWRLENCLVEKKGAGATVCGIRFSGFDWKGHVLGDSCLITVDENDRIQEIYQSQEQEFGNHPDYFDSMFGGKGQVKEINGSLCKNHKILLVTDAIADFLSEKQKEGTESKYLTGLLQISSHKEFCNMIRKWQDEEKLHNDDCTLITIEYDGNEEFEVVVADDLERLCEHEQKGNTEEIVFEQDVDKEDDSMIEEAEGTMSSLSLQVLKKELLELLELINKLQEHALSQKNRVNKTKNLNCNLNFIKGRVKLIKEKLIHIIKLVTDGKAT